MSPADGSLTVVFAPNSFKGSLTSVEVALALSRGWARARPDDVLVHAPLADGGEGTIAAIALSGGWQRLETRVHDPLGRTVMAAWLRSNDASRGVVEMAEASGLSRLSRDERDPIRASTVGTGEVIRSALDAGVRRLVLGIGGSATTDGGAGLLGALGVVGSRDSEAPVELLGLDPRLAETELRIACDVTNPLLGPTGAAATYGPQKGATPEQVVELDRRLAGWADRLETATGRRERDVPGAGAAGGVGFGLLCLTNRFQTLELVPGVDLVAEETGLDAKLARADIVITGEGRIDAQTAFGKTALGVARRARQAGVRCIAVGGGVEPAGIDALAAVGAEVVPVHEVPIALDEAIAAGAAPLIACAERLARTIMAAR